MYWLKTTCLYCVTISAGQESRHGLARPFASGSVTGLQSRSQPRVSPKTAITRGWLGLQSFHGSTKAGSHFKVTQWFLVRSVFPQAVGLRPWSLAGSWPEAALHPSRWPCPAGQAWRSTESESGSSSLIPEVASHRFPVSTGSCPHSRAGAT